MKNQNSHNVVVLLVQAFTVALLIFTLVFDDNMMTKRRENDTSPQLEKFRNKFQSTRTTSDSALQGAIIEGFVDHMLAINQAVMKTEDAYHNQISTICYGLIIMNCFAFMISVKRGYEPPGS